MFFHHFGLWVYYVCLSFLEEVLFSNLQVDLNNLEEYISLVVDASVKTGITRQMEAFRAGFNQVFFLNPFPFQIICSKSFLE